MGFREQVRNDAEPGNPPTWSPDPGGELFVTVTAEAKAIQTRHGIYPRAVVECEDTGQRYTVWLAATVLREKWLDAAPKVGERVGIIYHGKQEARTSDRQYNDFTLDVDRSGPSEPRGATAGE